MGGRTRYIKTQGNDSSSEKFTTAAKTCSTELFKEKPGLCAAIYALAHNKESSGSAAEKPVENLNLFSGAHNNRSTSAEKPAESGTIISAPIEVRKGPTMEEKKASAGECPAGQAKDWAGICFPLKECKASISAQPGTCTQSEEEKTNGVLTGALKIKKPATSSNPESENCLKTETKSGESLCLNAPAISKLTPAYQTGWYGARAGLSASEACATKKFEVTTRFGSGYMSGYNPNDIKECNAGYADYKSPFLQPNNNAEKGGGCCLIRFNQM
ncbi:MAG: hypothetical protein WBF33_38735 [Candidatus Nitrosopolaris sp.]